MALFYIFSIFISANHILVTIFVVIVTKKNELIASNCIVLISISLTT